MVDVMLPELVGGGAKLVRWLAAPGEHVLAGAPLAIVLTERAEVLLPAPAGGVLQEPAPAGTTVEAGALLCRLVPAGPHPPAPSPASGRGGAEHGATRVRATPLARRIAVAHGLDLSAVAGTGRDGRICAADIQRLAQAPTARVERARPPAAERSEGALTPAAERSEGALTPASGASAHPSERSERAPQRAERAPIGTATVELDAGAALERLAALREPFGRLGLPVGMAALVVEAAAALLPAFPVLNGAWGGEVAILRRRVHIAAGEAGPAGMRWAAVRDAGDLTLRGVARAMARADGELDDVTFAVLSVGEGASWQSAAPPLAGTTAALSVGAPLRRAVAIDAAVALRPIAALSLSYDARLVDHARAAAFLRAICARLEARARS